MTLDERLRQHEGCESHPYTCPAGKITIGVGHNLTDNGLPDHIIEQILWHDIDVCRKELDRVHPAWRGYTSNRRDCLVELMFNMGWPALSTFVLMWGAIDRGDWSEAAAQLLDSRWAVQVGPTRASRLADLLEDG